MEGENCVHFLLEESDKEEVTSNHDFGDLDELEEMGGDGDELEEMGGIKEIDYFACVFCDPNRPGWKSEMHLDIQQFSANQMRQRNACERICQARLLLGHWRGSDDGKLRLAAIKNSFINVDGVNDDAVPTNFTADDCGAATNWMDAYSDSD